MFELTKAIEINGQSVNFNVNVNLFVDGNRNLLRVSISASNDTFFISKQINIRNIELFDEKLEEFYSQVRNVYVAYNQLDQSMANKGFIKRNPNADGNGNPNPGNSNNGAN